MSNTIAVTGATGFIGSAVTRTLDAAGWSIRILARSPAKAALLSGYVNEQVQGSLDDMRSLRKLMQGAYAVVHCAGVVRGATQAQFDAVNVDGVGKIVSVVKEQSCPPRILALSSLAAREPALSHYAVSKRNGEELLAEQARELEWIALRPPAVYGPGDREILPLFRWIGRGIAPILGSGESRFSMIHVDDLAAAVKEWLHRGACDSGVFELHDGRNGGYTWEDVINIASDLCDRKVLSVTVPATALLPLAACNRLCGLLFGYAPMLTPGKLRELKHANWVCDNSAFTRATGWTPEIDLEDGLRRLPGWSGFGALSKP